MRMKTLRRALLLVFVASTCFAQNAQRMDEVVQTYVRDDTFMGTVLVARGDEVDAQVEFFTDASGAVTHAVMYQNGRERKVPRTSATVVESP
jgi:hypothetical protein